MSLEKEPQGWGEIFDHEDLDFYRSSEFQDYVEKCVRLSVKNYIGSLLRSLTGVAHHLDIDDVTNDVFLKVYAHIDERVSGHPDATHRFNAFNKFVYTVARNTAYACARKAWRNRGLADFEEKLDRDSLQNYILGERGERVTKDDRLIALKLALDGLSEKDRGVLLSRAEGRSYRDIAEEFECSEGALKVRHYRAMIRLKGRTMDTLKELLRSEAARTQRPRKEEPS